MNLVSPATLGAARTRHFEDSLQLAGLVPASARTLFDWGSGAGFPGLVLAMARPDLAVHLVESDQKKGSFLRTVSRETSTPATVHSVRIETLAAEVGDTVPDVITARALAALPLLFDYALPWAEKNPDLVLIFPKGENAAAEITAAREAGFAFEVKTYRSRTEPGACILRITGLKKLPSRA